jgi:hypothetical protein
MEGQPNFTEDAVSIAIAMHLALLSFPRFQFSINLAKKGAMAGSRRTAIRQCTISAVLHAVQATFCPRGAEQVQGR